MTTWSIPDELHGNDQMLEVLEVTAPEEGEVGEVRTEQEQHFQVAGHYKLIFGLPFVIGRAGWE